MKIAILTQPLKVNYGGILQNYALQAVLKKMGHDVKTINRVRTSSLSRKLMSMIKRALFFRWPIRVRANEKEGRVLYANLKSFINNRILLTEEFSSFGDIGKIINNHNFDAYIVGSDQCWRPKYNNNYPSFFFFDFLNGRDDIKRIAYACSFGVDKWEYTDKQTIECAYLAKQFKAISVREDSAIALCKTHFGIEPIQLVDPTFLLSAEDYLEVIKDFKITSTDSGNEVVSYILDSSDLTENIIKKVEGFFNRKVYSLHTKFFPDRKHKKNIRDYILIPIEEWLYRYSCSNFIITDSFHGVVFSIIFNKQFVAIGNYERGMSRFKSLLKIFDLEDRLIYSIEDLTVELIENKINYDYVNTIIAKEREKSLKYLLSTLS